MGPGARASDPSGSSNQAARRETARTGQAIRQAGDPRVRDMALEPAPRRLVMNADRLGWVMIGESTSDNGVHVHRNANSMCAPALPYTAACLTVVARPPERRRRSGAFGRRWERPPISACLDRHRGGRTCARPCHPPRRGRSRSISSLQEDRRAPGRGASRTWCSGLGPPPSGPQSCSTMPESSMGGLSSNWRSAAAQRCWTTFLPSRRSGTSGACRRRCCSTR